MRSSLAGPQKRIALIHRYIFSEVLWQNKKEALGETFHTLNAATNLRFNRIPAMTMLNRTAEDSSSHLQ
jgi:hypothetical protein